MNEQEFITKFLSDESFREELKKDPRGALRAHGLKVPDGIEIEVVETTATKHYIVLPPLETGELSDEAMSVVHGGNVPLSYICNNLPN